MGMRGDRKEKDIFLGQKARDKSQGSVERLKR